MGVDLLHIAKFLSVEIVLFCIYTNKVWTCISPQLHQQSVFWSFWIYLSVVWIFLGSLLFLFFDSCSVFAVTKGLSLHHTRAPDIHSLALLFLHFEDLSEKLVIHKTAGISTQIPVFFLSFFPSPWGTEASLNLFFPNS